jgi:hypothetical protein
VRRHSPDAGLFRLLLEPMMPGWELRTHRSDLSPI